MFNHGKTCFFGRLGKVKLIYSEWSSMYLKLCYTIWVQNSSYSNLLVCGTRQYHEELTILLFWFREQASCRIADLISCPLCLSLDSYAHPFLLFAGIRPHLKYLYQQFFVSVLLKVNSLFSMHQIRIIGSCPDCGSCLQEKKISQMFRLS